jgi:hypothetical protein
MPRAFQLLMFSLLSAATPAFADQRAPAPSMAPPQSEAPHGNQNVQLEVTVRTEEGGKAEVVYHISGVFGHGGRQQLNTGRDMFVTVPGAAEGGKYRPTGLSLTAEPSVRGRSVVLPFTLEFTLPVSRHPGERDMPLRVEQEATAILESGKPLTVFTSESPGQTPRTTVELTATILPASSLPQPPR